MLLLPPFLKQMGYDEIPIIKDLDSKSFIHKETHIEPVYPWYELRDIFEYLSCVEFARQNILILPKGKAISTKDVVPARYHSASFVFFCQAALDNLAVWINKNCHLNLKGADISFYKKKIQKKLIVLNENFKPIFEKNNKFLDMLNEYRMEWIHRLAGGANIFSDKIPSDHDANTSILIHIDPKLPNLMANPKQYISRIEEIKKENNGEWLISVDEFSNVFTEKTKNLTFELLTILVKILK